jgi:hypothetical protein
MAQAHSGGAPSPTRAAQLLASSAAAVMEGQEAIALTPPGEDAMFAKVAKTGGDDHAVAAADPAVVLAASPPTGASLGETLEELMRVDADVARATVTAELGGVFEHGGVCFCGAA